MLWFFQPAGGQIVEVVRAKSYQSSPMLVNVKKAIITYSMYLHSHVTENVSTLYECSLKKQVFIDMKLSFRMILLEGAFGMDCANLGIALSNRSSSGTHALPDSGKNQGMFFMIIGTMFVWMNFMNEEEKGIQIDHHHVRSAGFSSRREWVLVGSFDNGSGFVDVVE